MTTESTKSALWMEPLGLLILRLGLGWFLLVWAVNKLLAPGQYAKIWGYFHGIGIDTSIATIMGVGQIVLVAFLFLGLFRPITYALAFLTHTVTIVVIAGPLLAPFVIKNGYPTNRNQSIALAAWAGFAALFFLRRQDRWSLDAWIKRRRAKTA